MDWFKDVEDSGVQIQPEECLLAGSGTHVAAGGAKDALRKAELAVTKEEHSWLLREYWPPLMAEIVVLLKESVMDMTFWKSPTGSPYPSGLVNLALSAANMDDIKGFVSVSGDRIVRAELHIKVHSYNRGNATKVCLQPDHYVVLNQIEKCRTHATLALDALSAYDHQCEGDPLKLLSIIDDALEQISLARDHLLEPAAEDVFPRAVTSVGGPVQPFHPHFNADHHHMDFYLSGNALACAFFSYKIKDAPELPSHGRHHRGGSKDALGSHNSLGSDLVGDVDMNASASHHFRLLPRFATRRRSASVDASAAKASLHEGASSVIGERGHAARAGIPRVKSKQFLTTSNSHPDGLSQASQSTESIPTTTTTSHGRKAFRVKNKLLELTETVRIESVFPQLARVFEALIGVESFCVEMRRKLLLLSEQGGA